MQSVTPRPLGNQFLPYGTPLHIRDLLLTITRETFSAFPEDYPYRFVADDYDKTGVGIDTDLNKDSGVYGKKPLIVVSRGSQSIQPIVIGDRAAIFPAKSTDFGVGMVQASISFRILSKIKEESDIIGQIVFGMLSACRTMLPGILGIHSVESIQASDVSRFDQDDAMFLCMETMMFSMQYHWFKFVKDPIIAGIQNCLELKN